MVTPHTTAGIRRTATMLAPTAVRGKATAPATWHRDLLNEGTFADFVNSNAASLRPTTLADLTAVRADRRQLRLDLRRRPRRQHRGRRGDSDVAYVTDPFGAAGSSDSAVAGGGGFTNDLAEVLFAHGNATADSANLLYDIVSLFGNFTGTFESHNRPDGSAR